MASCSLVAIVLAIADDCLAIGVDYWVISGRCNLLAIIRWAVAWTSGIAVVATRTIQPVKKLSWSNAQLAERAASERKWISIMNSARGSSSLRFYTAPPSALSVPCCAYSTDCLKQQRRAAAHHVGHKGRKTREMGPTGRMQNVAAHSAATCAFAERCWLRLLVTGGRHCCCYCVCQCCCCCLPYNSCRCLTRLCSCKWFVVNSVRGKTHRSSLHMQQQCVLRKGMKGGEGVCWKWWIKHAHTARKIWVLPVDSKSFIYHIMEVP